MNKALSLSAQISYAFLPGAAHKNLAIATKVWRLATQGNGAKRRRNIRDLLATQLFHPNLE
jgi:hypothetical protein